jgi:SAM-dependent methyltransferase
LSRLTSFVRGLLLRGDIQEIIAGLDDKEIEALRSKYSGSGWLKYLDFQKYLPITLGFCQKLELNGSPPRQILDIGCGTGLFLYCAQHFGHRGIGIDIENAFMSDMAELLKVDRRISPVRPFVPIPIEGTFDVITAMGTQFDAANSAERRWGPGEWLFFLRDVEAKLSEDGQVFLRINRGREARLKGLNYYDVALYQVFRHGSLGGISFLFDRDGLNRAIRNLEGLD